MSDLPSGEAIALALALVLAFVLPRLLPPDGGEK